ncbi:transcription factor Adf-1-like [Plectropomus leopardus]|uniref:transcription factor Adf-1-like n=1 Tax=Plectropomus leopardus TaxID=160734 RepID=UPI001C4B8AAD|nr:transcription factor Adf-1-like [Plectropomus leopardus]
MNEFESRLAEQVRQYKHLYDPAYRDRSYIQMASNSWKEIAATLGKDEAACRRVWKSTRDCFVKVKRKRSRSRIDGTTMVPRILVELDWLSQFVKHRETENDLDLEDKMEMDSDVQKPTSKLCTLDDTRIEPPISSSTPGNFSPSPYLAPLSGPSSVETASCSSPSPRRDSPPSSGVNDVHALKLELLEQERHKMMQQDNADSRFAEVIKDMLANIHPKHKPDVKFKVYQLLFEAERDFPKHS